MKKVLWFIKGDITEKHIAEAKSKGLTIRSADAYHDGDFIEVCDGVTGDAPKAYADLYGEATPITEPKQSSKAKKPAEASGD